MSQNNEATWKSALCLQTSKISRELMLNPPSLQNSGCRNLGRQYSKVLHHPLLPIPKLLHKLSPCMNISGKFWFALLGKWLYWDY